MGIRVVVCGANGRMGREVVKAVLDDPDLELVGAAGRSNGVGQDVGTLIGRNPVGIVLLPSLEDAIDSGKPDVVVDFTTPASVKQNLKVIAEHKAHAVVGTSGLRESDIPEIACTFERHGKNAVIAPNFSLGAVLLLKLALEVSKIFPQIEIVETHHDAKLDAPSGTAIRYAEAIARARASASKDSMGHEKLPGARGAQLGGIRIHSVRLPGFLAQHTVVAGSRGERLLLTHECMSRDSFMPGVLLAVKKVPHINGVVYGLENLLETRAKE
ncbi:MAG: 4-hydroxy-tetrahydrodipicolinate reductase [Bacillota bacterium]